MRIIRYYGIIRSSQSDLESVAWFDGYNYKSKEKNKQKSLPLQKKESVIFSVQYIIANHVISHPVISTILDVEKQQHNNQILHIHLLLKTIRKKLFTAILYHLAFTHS